MVNDTVQDVNQALHNLAMAAWVGGTLFGRAALNPSAGRISSLEERGAIVNGAWNTFNTINAVALAAVGLGHVGGRLTELRSGNLSRRERPMVRAMDVFTATGVATGVVTGVLGARLAREAPAGAVPMETGARPSGETRASADRLQRSINVLGTINLLSGMGLVTSTGLFWRSAVSHPPLRRALRRRAS